VYKEIWPNPIIGEELPCEREIGNLHDLTPQLTHVLTRSWHWAKIGELKFGEFYEFAKFAKL